MVLDVKKQEQKRQMLPTPPLPEGAREVELTDNARQVFMRRYVRRGADGEPIESVEETFWRIAYESFIGDSKIHSFSFQGFNYCLNLKHRSSANYAAYHLRYRYSYT